MLKGKSTLDTILIEEKEMIVFIGCAILCALIAALVLLRKLKSQDPGTELMQEVALAIEEGASAFLRYELRRLVATVVIIAVLLIVFISWTTGAAFLLGAGMSVVAGSIGLRVAILANVRTANVARTTNSVEETMKSAFRGGSVVGLSVGGFALLGLGLIYLVFGLVLGQFSPGALRAHTNWIGVSFLPFTMTVIGYALGCSVIALFNRIGGGIYTKAADIGADLVGKAEAGIPEDDPRNPATVADNVGDAVGDVAGFASDILESYVAALISSIVLASYMFFSATGGADEITRQYLMCLFFYPISFAGMGLVASFVGILFLSVKTIKKSPFQELMNTTKLAAAVVIAGSAVIALIIYYDIDCAVLGFRWGVLSPWFCTTVGVLGGIVIGRLSEQVTSYDFSPTQKTAEASREGAALTILQGVSSGMRSVLLPVIVLGSIVFLTTVIAGVYGIALAATGMIGFVASTISVDTFGPIIDNAGGICEMADLDDRAREITDTLDSVGNTTDAIGKGYAIGSAALATLSLFSAFLYNQMDLADPQAIVFSLNIFNPPVLVGTLIGAALPFYFSGVLIEAVSNAARKMVTEVRRQLKIDPTILRGEGKPDYQQCIEISSLSAVKDMNGPALLGLLSPLVLGFLFGGDFTSGMILGALLSGVMLSLFSVNSGGAWDNGKKFIEKGRYGGKGSPSHAAAVIGDTVGDPLKDTVGPAVDILIKIIAVVSLLAAPLFRYVNLPALIGG